MKILCGLLVGLSPGIVHQKSLLKIHNDRHVFKMYINFIIVMIIIKMSPNFT